MEFKHFLENKNFDYVVKDLKIHHHTKCDACFSFPIKTCRWKCCNCEFRNICDICVNIIEKNIQPFSDEIQENLKIAGCNAINHVFMKIIFDAPIRNLLVNTEFSLFNSEPLSLPCRLHNILTTTCPSVVYA